MTSPNTPREGLFAAGSGVVADAFRHGDLMSAALDGDRDQWQYHAALGIIKDSQEGLDGLAGFDHDDARFYSAVLSWLDGDEEAACQTLEKLNGLYARNLLDLIRKPKIEVLSYLPPVRHGFFVIADAIGADEKFVVNNVGPFPGDMRPRPFASVRDYYDEASPPDFFLVNLVEWHQIPPDMQELPCPTIGVTNDFDMHIQGVRRWLPPFDFRMVIDHSVEFPKVRGIGRAPTVTYPMVFGIPEDMPKLNLERPRDVDVFFSGTLISGYHPDKERFIFQLLDNKDENVLLIDGHISVERYLNILSRSKITPSFCRHPGGIQTRVIESLCMGSIAMVQSESIMRLWADEDTGLFSYEVNEGPTPTIGKILADFDRLHAGCINNIDRLRRYFGPKRIASRFFRYCAVLAARPRDGDRALDEFINQKRILFAHGPSLQHSVAVDLAERNTARMAEEFAVKDEAWIGIEQAREELLVYSRAMYDVRMDDADPGQWRRPVVLFDRVAERFPDNLVARFNAFRVRLHFGDSESVDAAIKAGEVMVGADSNKWKMDPRDDILPYDFFDRWFNYREYLDLTVDLLVEDDVTARQRLCDLVIASVHNYLAVILADPTHAARACELDGSFRRYQLSYAELLADKGTMDAAKAAAGILEPLALRSTLARRSHSLLHSLKARYGDVIDIDMSEPDDVSEKIQKSLLQNEHHFQKVKSPYFKNSLLRAGGVKGLILDCMKETKADKPLLSVIVCGLAGWTVVETLEALAIQTLPRNLFEIIYVDCYATVPPEANSFADYILTLDQQEFLENQAIGYYEGFAQARGELLMIVQPNEVLPEDMLSNIMTAFYGGNVDVEIDENWESECRPKSLVLCNEARNSAHAPGFAVFPVCNSVRAGGIETIEPFQGGVSCVANLIDRMARMGTPVFRLSSRNWQQTSLTPWWTYGEKEDALLTKISKVLWPEVYEPDEFMPHSDKGAHLVEEGRTSNLVKHQGAYYVVPQILGGIDWAELGPSGHADVFESYNFSQAQFVLHDKGMGGDRQPDVILFGESRRALRGYLRANDLYGS